MSVSSTADYFALLEKSGVIDPASLADLRIRYSDVSDVRQLASRLAKRKVLTDWQARFLLSGRHRLKVGQYQLLERFNKHSIGDRFLARHERLDRKVDVLILPKSASYNQSLFKKFLEQASSVAKLDHDHLLHVYDIDQDRDQYYLVFEHDAGQSLADLPKGNLDAREIAAIVQQLLEGMAYAHENGILHGKLDATQIRVDRKNHVRIRNIGLAKLLDQLLEQDEEADDFVIPPHPVEDVAAIGRIGSELFEHHIGKPRNELEQKLYQWLVQLGNASENNAQPTVSLAQSIASWQRQFDMEHPQKASEIPTEVTKPGEPSSKGNTVSPPKHPALKRQLSWLTICAALVLALLGGLLWVLLIADRNQQQSENRSTTKPAVPSGVDSDHRLVPLSPLDSEAEAYAKNGQNPESKSKLPTQLSESKSPTRQNRQRPEDLDSKDQEPPDPTGFQLGPETGTLPGPTVAASPPGIDSETAAAQAATGASRGQVSVRQDSDLAPPGEIVMPQVDGLMLIPWQEAENHLQEEAVVFGTILGVGSSRSGKTRYLNFNARDFDVFKIVVRDRDLEITEEELKQRFLNRHVCVRGKIETYRENPQMKLLDFESIIVVPHLPGPETRLLDANDPTANSVESSGVFAGMSNGLDIPVWSRETTEFPKAALGPVQAGDAPVGLFLTVPQEACERPISFNLRRDQSGRRWEIGFAAKAVAADSEHQVVAEIHLDDDQLYFNWISSDKFEPLVNHLRNCLLQIKTGDEAKTVLLRKLSETEPLVLPAKRPVAKLEISLDHLPAAESLSIEFLPLPKEEFEVQIADDGLSVDSSQPAVGVYFDALPENQFFRLWYEAEIGRRIKLNAALQINTPNKPTLFNARHLKELTDQLGDLQVELNRRNAEAIQYEPRRGEKTKHKELLKDLSARLERINGQVAAFQATQHVAASIMGRPLGYRVYYTVGDIRYTIASSPSDEGK